MNSSRFSYFEKLYEKIKSPTFQEHQHLEQLFSKAIVGKRSKALWNTPDINNIILYDIFLPSICIFLNIKHLFIYLTHFIY